MNLCFIFHINEERIKNYTIHALFIGNNDDDDDDACVNILYAFMPIAIQTKLNRNVFVYDFCLPSFSSMNLVDMTVKICAYMCVYVWKFCTLIVSCVSVCVSIWANDEHACVYASIYFFVFCLLCRHCVFICLLLLQLYSMYELGIVTVAAFISVSLLPFEMILQNILFLKTKNKIHTYSFHLHTNRNILHDILLF